MIKIAVYYEYDEHNANIFIGGPKHIWLLWYNLHSAKKLLKIKKLVVSNLDGEEIPINKGLEEFMAMSTRME